MFQRRKARSSQKRIDSLIGAGTVVEGEVKVSHVVINGSVTGPVTATDYLELQAKARVNGDVVYRTLEMHVGAIVQGKLMHAEAETASVVELKRARGD